MIREFCEIGKNDIETVGGKGANLGEMTRAGINVPQGFVVTSNAYKLFLNENNINSEIKYLLGRAGNDEEELFKIAETKGYYKPAGKATVTEISTVKDELENV